ncbi:hypothetical protein BJ1_gp08 [Halorubrum virus BJ1]|uniref:Uncharacterized protein n=1 Tax=Halorubrum virus BJ1 TaxID=416419 RepID=A0ZYM1_9CAUD|nr:hypothetical protein BJ1_gp08 [Halorubrum virus BJ1]CAL92430.1 hypothetical protein [Halorubrum virus BJ1]
MRDITRTAEKRMHDIESEAADEFEATILENRMYEAIGQSDEVRQLVDVAERAYALEGDKRYVRRARRAAFGAAEELNEQIDLVVDAAIAAECEAVIEDARDGWFDDHADDEEIEAAFHEACVWLTEYERAARDAGIDVDGVVWNKDADNKEVTPDV